MAARKSILVVGVGSIGERHTRTFLAAGRTNVSICETNATLRKTVADKYNVSMAFESLEAALETRPDAAVICTPAHAHIPIALKAAKNGAHLLIEKPLSISMDGIQELSNEVQSRKLHAAVAYVYRAHPALSNMRDAIARGAIGKPVQAVAVCGQNFPTYRPAYREIYYRDRATGGGAIQDALTHILNAAEWIVGPIRRLTADASHQVLEGVAVEDTAHLITRHRDVLGSFSLNQYQAPNETTLTIVGTAGTARFEYHANRWRLMTRPETDWQDHLGERLERDTLFVRQATAFLDTIDGKRPPLCSLEEGIQTLRVNLAALRSLETGAWENCA